MPYPLKMIMGTMQRRLGLSLATRYAPVASTTMAKSFFSTKVQETETFLNGSSSLYAEQMYDLYAEDPTSVPDSWRRYFDNLEAGVPFSAEDYSSPTAIPGKKMAVGVVRICKIVL